jgi:hypothetical protein
MDALRAGRIDPRAIASSHGQRSSSVSDGPGASHPSRRWRREVEGIGLGEVPPKALREARGHGRLAAPGNSHHDDREWHRPEFTMRPMKTVLALFLFAFSPSPQAARAADRGGLAISGAGGSRLFLPEDRLGPRDRRATGGLFFFEELKPLADRFTVSRLRHAQPRPLRHSRDGQVAAHDRPGRCRTSTPCGVTSSWRRLPPRGLLLPRPPGRAVRVPSIPKTSGASCSGARADESSAPRIRPRSLPADRSRRWAPTPRKSRKIEKLREAGAYKGDPKRFCVRLWGVQRYRAGRQSRQRRAPSGRACATCPTSGRFNLFNHFDRSMASIKESRLSRRAMLAAREGARAHGSTAARIATPPTAPGADMGDEASRRAPGHACPRRRTTPSTNIPTSSCR